MDLLARERKKYCERLRNVVRVLQGVKSSGKLFSLKYWGTKDEELIREMIDDGDLPEGSCGTVCCAIGWVGFDPWFRARGFRTIIEIDEEFVWSFHDETFEPRYAHDGYIDPAWVGVRVFFDLTEHQTDKLFLDGYYEEGYTIDDVIQRVSEFIVTKYGEEHWYHGD